MKEGESMLKKIINADDFGISPGVNSAIVRAFKKGVLNSTSMMMNVAYTDQAIALYKQNPGLNVGVHLNLTNQLNQRPLAHPKDIGLLVDKDGRLKHGFVSLMLLSFFKKKELSRQLEIEMRAQIDKAFESGIVPTHLDSHRHVHMIPAVFKVAQKLQKQYGIARLRVLNENVFYTFLTAKNWKCFWDGGLIKYAVLKTFYYWNRTKSDTYFYSVVYTTRLFGKNVRKIKVPRKFAAVEFGTHPSMIEVDAANFEPAFYNYLLDRKDRRDEFDAIMDKSLLSRIVQG